MKYAWIEAQAGWQPIARLCKALGVSRSGFLQWRKRGPSDRELANRSLDAQVAVIHAFMHAITAPIIMRKERRYTASISQIFVLAHCQTRVWHL